MRNLQPKQIIKYKSYLKISNEKASYYHLFVLDLSVKLEETAVLLVFKKDSLHRLAGECHREGEALSESSCTENLTKQPDKWNHLS